MTGAGSPTNVASAISRLSDESDVPRSHAGGNVSVHAPSFPQVQPGPDPGGDGRIRVVLAEDNLIAREGIIRVLEGSPSVELVAACPDLPSLRRAAHLVRPDVVLTDIRLPPTQTDEGIRFAQELRSTHPGVGVVVLSHHVEPMYALALLEQGSRGRAYLLKERLKDAEELSRAVHAVAHDAALIDPRVVDAVIRESDARRDAPLAKLTPREREVLALVAEGRSNGAIADALAISSRSVERHINAIFTKLGLAESRDVSRRVKATLLYLAGSPARS
jgi:DNA-binding NarL/FixJ family response regulator